MTRVVALTGGIGSGKSTVARIFEKLGAVLIDADAITHELQARGSPLLAEIVEAFGPDVLDEKAELDREALGALVFRDPEARARLNALVHPQVGAEMGRRLAEAQAAGAELVILDIPLLYEGRSQRAAGGARGPLDGLPVVLVYAPAELQIERQLERESYDRAEAERRLAAQLPIEEKRGLADFVIDNSGSLAETERQVEALFRQLLAPAA